MEDGKGGLGNPGLTDLSYLFMSSCRLSSIPVSILRAAVPVPIEQDDPGGQAVLVMIQGTFQAQGLS